MVCAVHSLLVFLYACVAIDTLLFWPVHKKKPEKKRQQMKRSQREYNDLKKIKVEDTITESKKPEEKKPEEKRYIDMSFRDMTGANKYMRPLNINAKDKRIEGEFLCAANIAKMNLEMTKLNNKIGLYNGANYDLNREVCWRGDFVINPLPINVNLPLDTFNVNNAINYLLPTDPKIFYYDYTNEKEHDFKRNFLIRQCEFSPYGSLPVHGFCPIFIEKEDASGNTWYTFGLAQKFQEVYDIQQSIKNYTATVIPAWFPECTEKVKESLKEYGLSEIIAKAYKLDLEEDSYSGEHDMAFLKLVLTSSKLTWYKSELKKPYDKTRLYMSGDYVDDKNFSTLVNDKEKMEVLSSEVIYYVITDEKYHTYDKIADDIADDIGVKRTDKNMKKFRFLCYLWCFQNSLCIALEEFMAMYEGKLPKVDEEKLKRLVDIDKKRASEDKNAVKDMNTACITPDNVDVSYEKDVEEFNNIKNILDEVLIAKKKAEKSKDKKAKMEVVDNGPMWSLISKFERYTKFHKMVCDIALASKHLSIPENNFKGSDVIWHKFISFTPSFKKFLFINYKGDIAEPDNVAAATEDDYRNNFGQILIPEEPEESNKSSINGKSVVFKYDIFTIFLYVARKGKDRTAGITKEGGRNNKSDLEFERVIVTWENNFIEFSNTSGNDKIWYEAYHTYGQGVVKGLSNGFEKVSSDCVMIRFRPEMNITYKYKEKDVLEKNDRIHMLFKLNFYILDYYFSYADIQFIEPEVDMEHNRITTYPDDDLVLRYALTKDIEHATDKEGNVYSRDAYKYSVVSFYEDVNNNKNVYFAYDKEGRLFENDVIKDPKNDRDWTLSEIIERAREGEGRNDQIMRDEDWLRLIGVSEKKPEIDRDEIKEVSNDKISDDKMDEENENNDEDNQVADF